MNEGKKMRKQKLKLGDVQQDVLEEIFKFKGWRGHGWVWETVSYTRRVLNGLCKHGLVEFTESTQTYLITERGIKHLKTIRPHLFK